MNSSSRNKLALSLVCGW